MLTMKFLYSCTAFMLLNPSSDAANLIPASDSRGVVTLSEVTLDSQPQIVSNGDSLQNTELTEPTISTPSHKVPPKVVRGMTLGFGISGGAITISGIAVTAAGGALVNKAGTCNDPTKKQCVFDFRDALRTRDTGVMVLGGGLGLLGGGLPWLVKDARTRRTIWIAETAIGGASFVGGLISIFFTSVPFNRANITGKIERWEDHHTRFRSSAGHAIAFVSWGLGIGLIASSTSGLLVQRRYLGKKLHLQAQMDFQQVGVMLSGSF